MHLIARMFKAQVMTVKSIVCALPLLIKAPELALLINKSPCGVQPNYYMSVDLILNLEQG